MITEINEFLNVNLIVESVRITTYVSASVNIGKNIIRAKKFIFRILLGIVLKIVNM